MTGSVAATLSARQDSPAPPEPERYARRAYPPPADTWIRESGIPAEPQTTPFQVIWEVSLYAPTMEPTVEQRQAAESLIERSYASARKHGWYDANKAMADGYAPMYLSPMHYAKAEYVVDDAILDPERPEFLMYYHTPRGLALAGYMFLVNEPRARGPQIGGPLTVWHYHVWASQVCLLQGLLVVASPQDGKCPRGEAMSRSPEMVHVWLIDRPEGPFETEMGIPSNVLLSGLERRLRERGF
jgi:hypothetical protein